MTKKDESIDPVRIQRRLASAKSTAEANAQAAKVLEGEVKTASKTAEKARAALAQVQRDLPHYPEPSTKHIPANTHLPTSIYPQVEGAEAEDFANGVMEFAKPKEDPAHQPMEKPFYEWEFFGPDGEADPIVQRAQRGDVVFKEGAQNSYAMFEQFLPASLGERCLDPPLPKCAC